MAEPTGLAGLFAAFTEKTTEIFLPILKPVFNPIDKIFTPIPEIVWTLCAIGLFVAAMIWVFSLKKEYVNIDAPRKNIFFDLRFWTVVSMLPHIVVYLYFGVKAAGS